MMIMINIIELNLNSNLNLQHQLVDKFSILQWIIVILGHTIIIFLNLLLLGGLESVKNPAMLSFLDGDGCKHTFDLTYN